ncbi:MAG: hypothetical protein JJT94_02890 [Bernardetiaceae bacterium]|nr:hypothetical protein [Bernardetiaceae bacterium]
MIRFKEWIAVCMLFVALFWADASQAQTKNWAIGVRAGEPTGLNIKKYFSEKNALDINIGIGGYGYSRGRSYGKGEYRQSTVITINYLWQQPIGGIDGLELYYGLGGQLGSRSYYDYGSRSRNLPPGLAKKDYYDRRETFYIGVTGVVGAEYFISSTPLSVFFDIGPYLEALPNPLWLWFDAGLGLRVNF